MLTHLERAMLMNAKQRASLVTLGLGWTTLAILPGIAGLLALAFSAGFNAPMPQRTYDLVMFQGEESDIVDYDLSASDCVAAIGQMRAAGLDVTCETTR